MSVIEDNIAFLNVCLRINRYSCLINNICETKTERSERRNKLYKVKIWKYIYICIKMQKLFYLTIERTTVWKISKNTEENNICSLY